MKKIAVILLLTCFIFLICGQIFDNNGQDIAKEVSDTEMHIGGRLPVDNTVIKKNSVESENKSSKENGNNNKEVFKSENLSSIKEETNSKIVIRDNKADKNVTENDGQQDTERINTKIEINNLKKEKTTIKPENKRTVSLIEQIKEYTVKHGESLWTISRKYNIDIDTLIGANDISNMNMINKGDKLKILPVKGILYRINPGESLWLISRNFNVSIDKIVAANNINNPEMVKPGDMLILPGAKPEFGYKERMSSKLMCPVAARISSYYGMRWGRMHEGIDFAVNTGTKIKAAAAGKIIYSGWASGYGYTVIIEHQKGVRTLYAHNSKLVAHSGQYVNKGQVICYSGNTGNSTGPHLHFEVQINGRPVNPLSYINVK